MALKRGDKAPEILGVDQGGRGILIKGNNGSKWRVYFNTKDNKKG